MNALLRSERGAVAVETSIALVALATLISGGLTVIYVVFARVWIERQTYEAVVCLGSLSKVSECERRFRKRTEQALPIGRISRLQISRSEKRASVFSTFEVSGKEIAHEENQRGLPLFRGGIR